LLALVALGPAACGAEGGDGQAGEPALEPPVAAIDAISADSLRVNIAVLAHDSLEGRAPGTPGEQKTIRFLTSRFEALGLQPGNDGSWTQNVPLVSLTPEPTGLEISGDEESETFEHGTDFVATTEQVVDEIGLQDSELVFAGYGIVAPEYGWNDYQGLDAEGKTVVILVNDPGYATEDDSLFNGRTMTYYGRWTYKYEEAARQGAAGALIVHRTGPAGYPWNVVESGWTGPQFGLAEPVDAPLVDVGGWITEDVARNLFTRAGLDFDALDAEAAEAGFEAVPLGTLKASVQIRNAIERSESPNFLALMPGAERPDEYVIYTAHYDHFGVDPGLEGDQIYNGARDNASGTAGLIELARAFRAAADAGRPPERSVMFLAVTAEEQGLLGSAYYASHPVVPLERTAAVINMDALNTWGATNDVTVVGLGSSELDDYAEGAAAAQGRRISADPEPEKGYYFRSDHFEFAKQGVPALYTDPGVDMVDGGEERGLAELAEYTEERYHQVDDELDDTWDLSGAVQDLELFFRVGWRIVGESSWPNWREGSEFRAIRDEMMGQTETARSSR
jgi:Zn-dependent M28 family amino/carboxypeptidase